jgi:hypothetical protein
LDFFLLLLVELRNRKMRRSSAIGQFCCRKLIALVSPLANFSTGSFPVVPRFGQLSIVAQPLTTQQRCGTSSGAPPPSHTNAVGSVFVSTPLPPPLPATLDPNSKSLQFVERESADGSFICEDRLLVTTLVVRPQYFSLWARVEKSLLEAKRAGTRDNHLIIGHPGIGKSLGALNFVLMSCLKAHCDVVIVVVALSGVEIYEHENNQWQRVQANFRDQIPWFPETIQRLTSHPAKRTRPILLLHDVKTSINLSYQEWFHVAPWCVFLRHHQSKSTGSIF